jgi:hypothetical protein
MGEDNGNGGNGGWKEWSNYVLKELERLNDNVETVKNEIGDIKISLATLQTSFKIKSGIWGAIAGLIPAVAVLIYTLLGKKP